MTGRGTRVVKAGLPEARQGEPFLPGPVFAAPFHLSGDPDSSPASYTRYGNPTWEAYERAVGSLEDAEAVLFSSGMAAAVALMLTELRPGSVLAIDSSCYLGVRRFAETTLAAIGVEVRQAVPAGLAAAAEGAAVLWLETPSNPKLEVYDIAALAAVADAQGALTVVDNTTAGALLQQPLDLGAGAVLTSATKQMAGHSDLLLGYVTTRDTERGRRLRDWRRDAGPLAGPFEAWLAHRSLATLGVRLERACANAGALAELIASRGDVPVAYPGLPSDRGHEIARRQMSGFGGVVSFDLETEGRAERFFAAAQLITQATSFGGVHTTAERRARWGGDDVSEGFVRLSAGIEDTADLTADVERALDTCFR